MDENKPSNRSRNEADVIIISGIVFVIAIPIASLPNGLLFLILLFFIELYIVTYLNTKNKIIEEGIDNLLIDAKSNNIGLGARSQTYQYVVRGLLNGISKQVGDQETSINGKYFSAKSFLFSLKLSSVYPFFLFIIGWMLGGSNTIGNLSILEGIDKSAIGKYIGSFLAVVLVASVIGYFCKQIKWKILKWFSTILVFIVLLIFLFSYGVGFENYLSVNYGMDISPIPVILMAFGLISYLWVMTPKNPVTVTLTFFPIWLALGVMISIPYAGRLPAVILGIFALTATFWDRRSLGWIFVFFVISLIVGSILFAIHIDQPNDKIFFLMKEFDGHIGSVFLVVFFGLLPVINGLIDWISINITRHILKYISEKKLKLKIVFSVIFIDLILALIMCAFLFALMYGFGFFVENFGGEVEPSQIQNTLDGKAFQAQLWNAIGSNNLFWLSAMMLTALIPTILSTSVVILAIFFSYMPKNTWFIETLNELKGLNSKKIKSHKHLSRCSTYVASTIVLSIILSAVSLFTFGLLVFSLFRTLL